MPYVTFITVLLLSVSAFVSFYHQLQILQKNKYSISSYFKWLKDSYTTQFALSTLFYCVITVCITGGKLWLSLILSLVLLAARIILIFVVHKNQSLGFTARVKRLYVMAIIILGVLIMASAIFQNATVSQICRMLCLLLSVITPALATVVMIVNRPIEKFLKQKKDRT